MNWIIIISVIVGIEAILVSHKLLLNWIPYRWIVGCLTYQFNKRFAKKRMLKMTFDELCRYSIEFQNIDRWFTPYWFYRSLVKVIDTEVLKRYNNGTT